MSTVFSATSPATGAKARRTPQICATTSVRYYRRSTTNRSPRKRTFLLTMTKYSSELTTPPGVTAAFANNVAMLSVGPCYNDDAALLCGDGAGSGGGHNNKNNKSNGGGDWYFAGEGASWGGFLPVLYHSLLGALAIIAAIAAFPARSNATQSPASTSTSPDNSPSSGSDPNGSLRFSSPVWYSRAADPLADVPNFSRTSSESLSSPSRPRSKVLHVPCKGSTLVVPLTGNGDAKAAVPRLAPWQRAKIVDAPIVLSGNEVAVLDLPQYRVRESMLV